MDIEVKKSLLESSLERAAERVGDITEPVLEIFYSRFPEARQRFQEWDPAGKGKLDAQMVEQSLYCLMSFFDRPLEIHIIVRDTVPYHRMILNVSPESFIGMIDATCDVITDTIPDTAPQERAIWDELRAAMHALVDKWAKEDWEIKPASCPA